MQPVATPLLNFFDLDPERLKPLIYAVTIDVPVIEGGIGQGSVQLRNQPFIVTKLTHRILGRTGDPESSGLYDDGQYLIEWKDDMRVFTPVPINADLLMGPKIHGEFPDLVYPIYYAGTIALHFRLTNQYARTLSPSADYFKVQIAVHGTADWGKLQPPQ